MTKQLENIAMDDAVLVEQCQQGHSAAMERLIVKYQDRIYNVVFKMCGNRDDAAELTQDIFVKFIEKINTFQGRSAFYTWLFRIAVNMTLNFCKRRFKVVNRSLDEPVGEQMDQAKQSLGNFLVDKNAVEPSVMAQRKEVAEIISLALGKLDDSQRMVLILRDIEGMSYAEVADSLDIELGTVKSRLSRARSNLREILESALQ